MSPTERNKLKKMDLINAILNMEEADLTSLNDSIKTLTLMIKNFQTEIVENSNKIITLQTEKTLMQYNIKILTAEIEDLNVCMNESEQRSRVNNIEIVGLRMPKETETDESLLIDFSKDILGLTFVADHFQAVHEVPTKRKDQKRVVIAAFVNRKMKKLILDEKEKLREFNKNNEHKIYVNEQLSPINRKIFNLALKRKWESNYKFIWARGGKTYVRKDEKSVPICIRSEKDITKIT